MKILLLLAAAGLLYILQDLIYKTFWDKNLSVSIHFQDKAVLEGEQATLTEVIENRKLLPLAYLNASSFGSTAILYFKYGKYKRF
ncbi:MAG: hypothetical protein ACLRZ6_03245 [Lachnospiraceae bacterium]